jgi:hypothetical protein
MFEIITISGWGLLARRSVWIPYSAFAGRWQMSRRNVRACSVDYRKWYSFIRRNKAECREL